MLQQRANLRNGFAKDFPGPSDASSKGRRRFPIHRRPEARHRRPEARYGGLARHGNKSARQRSLYSRGYWSDACKRRSILAFSNGGHRADEPFVLSTGPCSTHKSRDRRLLSKDRKVLEAGCRSPVTLQRYLKPPLLLLFSSAVPCTR